MRKQELKLIALIIVGILVVYGAYNYGKKVGYSLGKDFAEKSAN